MKLNKERIQPISNSIHIPQCDVDKNDFTIDMTDS